MHEKLLSLFNKGGYEVVYPEGLSARCELHEGGWFVWLAGSRAAIAAAAGAAAAAWATLAR